MLIDGLHPAYRPLKPSCEITGRHLEATPNYTSGMHTSKFSLGKLLLYNYVYIIASVSVFCKHIIYKFIYYLLCVVSY